MDQKAADQSHKKAQANLDKMTTLVSDGHHLSCPYSIVDNLMDTSYLLLLNSFGIFKILFLHIGNSRCTPEIISEPLIVEEGLQPTDLEVGQTRILEKTIF